MVTEKFLIRGQILNCQTTNGIAGLRIEAWDKNLVFNDLVGSAVTDSEGRFQIGIDPSKFQELFLDRKPDLFFKIYRGAELIKSTEDSVLWNVDAAEAELTIEVDPPPDSVTEKYSVQVTVGRPAGHPLAGILSKAFDIGLRKETFLGESITDEQGRCLIVYTSDQLSKPGKERADLLVRAFAADGTLLRESETVYNARAQEEVKLIADVPEQIELAEYDKLRKTLSPFVRDIPAANLTDKDIEYLLKKLDGEPLVDERRLRVLAEGSRIARDSGLLPEFVYGLAHGLDLSPPLSLDALLQHDDASIRNGLTLAVDEKVVSSKLSESIDNYLARMVSLKLDRGLLVKRNINGQLTNKETGKSLGGVHVRASHLRGEEEQKDLGYDITDKQGRFSFSIVTPPEGAGGAASGPPERLNLSVLDPQREEIYQAEFEIGPGREVIEVKVPSEQLPKPPAHPIAHIATELSLELPTDLRKFLAEHSIETLEDVRHIGGLRRLENLPLGRDHAMIRVLDSQANLSVLPTSARENARLIETGFHTFSVIARTPRKTFAGAVSEHLGVRKTMEIHAAALAQTKLLNSILTGIGIDLANGLIPPMFQPQPGEALDIDSESRLQPYREILSENCSCRDCEAAVSPGAYLADLLRYTIDHVQRDSQAITLQNLANLLHQPFGDLPVSCDASEEQVRQVRLCVEVLRHYLGWPLADAEEDAYRLDVYTTLLAKLGTSYEELLLAQTADDEARLALAERLGFGMTLEQPDGLRALMLPPASIDEAVLERLFGFVDTTRHPLSDGLTRGDADQQVVRWQLNGVEWNWNTSPEGIIYVRLSHSNGAAYRVNLYRDSERQQLVATGQINSLQGAVELSPRNDSDLSGSIDLDYAGEADDIELIAIPEFLSWRMQHLQSLWRAEDGISDLYGDVPPATHTVADLLSTIDPDVIGPDDFRTPFPRASTSDRVGPFDLWIERRSWVDEQLIELRDIRSGLTDDGQSDSDVIIDLLDRVSPSPHFSRPWPADPRQAPNMASLFRTLSENLSEGRELEETEHQIRAGLRLTINSFARLQELHAQAESQEEVKEDEWEEVYSILVQARKLRSFSAWREAERELELPDGQILFGPRHFWVSLREPIEGAWPLRGREHPLIDSELVKLSDLPEPAAGYRAITIWHARRTELDDFSDALKAEHEAAGSDGFNNVLVFALGTPPAHQAWATYLSDLLDRVGRAEVSGTEEERQAVREELEALHLDEDDLGRLVEVQTNGDSAQEAVDAVYAILTRCYKKREIWKTWRQEERYGPVLEGHYWLARKARLPKWRASAADRQVWQQALSNRSRVPTIEPDLVGADYLRGMPSTPAYGLWEDRVQWISEQIAELRSDREQAQTPLAGFYAILIASLFDAGTEAGYLAQYGAIHEAQDVSRLLYQALGFSQDELDLLLTALESTDTEVAHTAKLAVQQKLHLTVNGFGRLMDRLSDASGPWEDAYSILTRATLVASAMVLSRDENQGISTADRLAQLGLTSAAFSRLVRIRELLESDVSIQDSDWEDVYSILTQVRKGRAFADWRAEEQDESISLSSDFLQLPAPPPLQFPPPEPAALPAWRARRRDLHTWRGTLESRIDQLETVASALNDAVSATEEAVLPKLRDALIMAANVDGNDLSTKANNLAKLLLIDTKINGCQLTTRVSQAITSVLGLLWALRTRQLQDIYPDLSLTANDFDEEWKWIGSHGSWRAAMFTHLYPENLLLPTLRPRQTPGFDKLLETIRTNPPLTPERACLAANTYSDYFEDVCSLTVEATCYGETRIFNAEVCGRHAMPLTRNLFYMFGIGGKSGSLYWSAVDPEDEDSYSQSFWAPVPGLDQVRPTKIVGSVPYRKTDDQRFVVLLLLAEEEDGETQLLLTKYDLETGGNSWDNEPVSLALPSFRRIVSIVAVQSEIDGEPPRLAFAAQGFAGLYIAEYGLYVRSLSIDADDWSQEEPATEQEESSDTQQEQWLRYRVYKDAEDFTYGDPVPGELLLKRLLVVDITRDKLTTSRIYSDQHGE